MGAVISRRMRKSIGARNSMRNGVSHYALTRNLSSCFAYGLHSLRFHSKKRRLIKAVKRNDKWQYDTIKGSYPFIRLPGNFSVAK